MQLGIIDIDCYIPFHLNQDNKVYYRKYLGVRSSLCCHKGKVERSDTFLGEDM